LVSPRSCAFTEKSPCSSSLSAIVENSRLLTPPRLRGIFNRRRSASIAIKFTSKLRNEIASLPIRAIISASSSILTTGSGCAW
jgi:hypothetical protein